MGVIYISQSFSFSLVVNHSLKLERCSFSSLSFFFCHFKCLSPHSCSTTAIWNCSLFFVCKLHREIEEQINSFIVKVSNRAEINYFFSLFVWNLITIKLTEKKNTCWWSQFTLQFTSMASLGEKKGRFYIYCRQIVILSELNWRSRCIPIGRTIYILAQLVSCVCHWIKHLCLFIWLWRLHSILTNLFLQSIICALNHHCNWKQLLFARQIHTTNLADWFARQQQQQKKAHRFHLFFSLENFIVLFSDSPFNMSAIERKETEDSSIQLYWKNLSYQTPKNKVLINNLSGNLQSGFLTAVLGPSGSGKTTFFECLAKRKVKGSSGQIWVSSLSRFVSFVLLRWYLKIIVFN